MAPLYWICVAPKVDKRATCSGAECVRPSAPREHLRLCGSNYLMNSQGASEREKERESSIWQADSCWRVCGRLVAEQKKPRQRQHSLQLVRLAVGLARNMCQLIGAFVSQIRAQDTLHNPTNQTELTRPLAMSLSSARKPSLSRLFVATATLQ